ncbi:AraC family transcriptional regulator [Parablautia intestinalis]
MKERYNKTITDESLRETVQHGSEEYPFRYYLEDIWLFDFHCIDWHWHPEVEFVYIKKGTAEFLIGSNKYTLSAGTGIFINTQIIHRFESSESAVIPNIVFSPLVLAQEESLIYQKYIRPVLESCAECLIFSSEIPGQNDILNTLLSIFDMQESEDVNEIETVALLLRLWNMIYKEICITEKNPAPHSSAHTQARLQIMMQYIHKNYPQQISLEDIAKTVMLSKSSALSIFNRNLHISPVNYLVNYRLKRAAKLLVTTQNSVSSIARDTGFENIGYFCRRFKKTFGVTPVEYRTKAGR